MKTQASLRIHNVSLNSVSSQFARDKSSIARKPAHSKYFLLLKTFKKCNAPDFKFCLGKLNNKTFPHMV